MTQFATPEQASSKKATRAALGETLLELAREGEPIVAVDADLSGSTTMGKLGADEQFKDRLFNVGIAEQNMIDVAAGLSLTGKTAFTGSFAVFGTGRAYDQIRNTVCYSNLNVKICPTHSGISVGPDGGTHQMLEDIALMRALPGMRVLVPADYISAKAAIRIAAQTPGPVYVRLGRASLPQIYAEGESGSDATVANNYGFKLGRANVVREGSDVAIIACGLEVAEALKAADELATRGINAEVIDVFSVKPLDAETILASVKKCGRAVVAEEHSVCGGLCEAVSSLLAQEAPSPLKFVAMKDKFGKSGELDELLEHFELGTSAIVSAACDLCD
jgi:transketolase